MDSDAAGDVVSAVLTDCRIFIIGHNNPVERCLASCIPRRGETVIVSGDRFKVVNVQWMVIEHKMTCDVYVA